MDHKENAQGGGCDWTFQRYDFNMFRGIFVCMEAVEVCVCCRVCQTWERIAGADVVWEERWKSRGGGAEEEYEWYFKERGVKSLKQRYAVRHTQTDQFLHASAESLWVVDFISLDVVMESFNRVEWMRAYFRTDGEMLEEIELILRSPKESQKVKGMALVEKGLIFRRINKTKESKDCFQNSLAYDLPQFERTKVETKYIPELTTIGWIKKFYKILAYRSRSFAAVWMVKKDITAFSQSLQNTKQTIRNQDPNYFVIKDYLELSDKYCRMSVELAKHSIAELWGLDWWEARIQAHRAYRKLKKGKYYLRVYYQRAFEQPTVKADWVRQRTLRSTKLTYQLALFLGTLIAWSYILLVYLFFPLSCCQKKHQH
eukprot:TRINITY_DN7447_c0_g1_i1.p1 TRINITY_DN7447_c0_g1~~TRINITY_DN7447_c0_g1_i1.p1  ORF type:complete len:371 (+),score=69.86 TRINITY_DN7447_c0_g1_i1:72-1184(+)